MTVDWPRKFEPDRTFTSSFVNSSEASLLYVTLDGAQTGSSAELPDWYGIFATLAAARRRGHGRPVIGLAWTEECKNMLDTVLRS